MAAEAIGFDVGRPLMVVNCAQVRAHVSTSMPCDAVSPPGRQRLLLPSHTTRRARFLVWQLIDKYVGESAKNIEKVFEQAKAQDAVLVFDECEGLFAERSSDGGSTNRHDSMNVGVLLHHMETCGGVVVAITNRYAQIDTAFHRRFKFILEFSTPDGPTRAQLWRMLIPKEAPTAADVNFDRLGERYELSGGSIKSAVFRAADSKGIHLIHWLCGAAAVSTSALDALLEEHEVQTRQPFP